MPTIKGFSTKGKTRIETLKEIIANVDVKFKIPFAVKDELIAEKNPLENLIIENCEGNEQAIIIKN